MAIIIISVIGNCSIPLIQPRRIQCRSGNVRAGTFMIPKKAITKMVSIQELPGKLYPQIGSAPHVELLKKISGKLIKYSNLVLFQY